MASSPTQKSRPVRPIGVNADTTARTQAHIAAVEAEHRARSLVETIPGLVFITDATGQTTFTNQTLQSYVGVSPDGLLGDGWTEAIHPDDIVRTRSEWTRSIESGQDYEIEYRIRRYDGAYFWHLGRGIAVRDPSGQILKWLGISMDIHAQKILEQALMRSIDSLQQFAYVVSHDLQESIRAVNAYSQLLNRRYRETLDESSGRYLDFISSACVNMSRLVSDVLKYATASEDWETLRDHVDLNDVMRDIRDEFQLGMDEMHATIHCDSLPTVNGVASELRQVFQNLVSNALKYSRPDAPPRIQVVANRQAEYWNLHVSDNGQGFEAEDADKIFVFSKRLHGPEVPGNGIGLAIVKSIVERHGGEIWAEGKPGVGATIRFTIPAEKSYAAPYSVTHAIAS